MSEADVNEQIARRGVHRTLNAFVDPNGAPILPVQAFADVMAAKVNDGSLFQNATLAHLSGFGITDVLTYILRIFNQGPAGLPDTDLTNNELDQSAVDGILQYYRDNESSRLTDPNLLLAGNAAASNGGRENAGILAALGWNLDANIPDLEVTECGRVGARGIYAFSYENYRWEKDGGDYYFAITPGVQTILKQSPSTSLYAGSGLPPWLVNDWADAGGGEPVPVIAIVEI